ncbi:DUF262 domain-containing protein [Nonomuraea wenchangensis]
MRFQTSDPDIATIIRRIERGTIDLQPDFQRGEVWTTPKKQRLIDTILRQWHVPPIHLVAKGGGRFDVLDGQQRLTAIRDFVSGEFPVDGKIEPIVPEFAELHGRRYGQLPNEVRDQFETYAIRVFELHDYTPEEPHELFFRLNQPMTLTEAEKRNAFIGFARNQVKELVHWAEPLGMSPERLGFSNARMAYDDLVARFLLTLEQGHLSEKITALRITTRYRDERPFSPEVIKRAEAAFRFYFSSPITVDGKRGIKPNKATIHTWLCMSAKLDKENLLDTLSENLIATIKDMESWRVRGSHNVGGPELIPRVIFNDRATARVADVSSVLLRDLTGWMVFHSLLSANSTPLPGFLYVIRSAWDIAREVNPERALLSFAAAAGWGERNWL